MSSIVVSGRYQCEIDVTRSERAGMSQEFLATAARVVFVNAQGSQERVSPTRPFHEHAAATRDDAHRMAAQEFKTWVAVQRVPAKPQVRRERRDAR